VTTETIAAETAAVKSITLETITTLLAYHAAQNPQVEAIVDHESRLTFSGLEQRSRGRATWLVANGVNKGHRVALLMQNSVEWAINAYAIMRMGAVLVPLSTFLRPPELCAQLAAAGVRHLIAVSDFRGRNFHQEIAEIDRDTLPSLRNIWWASSLGDGPDSGCSESENEQAVTAALESLVRPADDMAIIFTSGSSGAPKGVIHTHGNAIRANAAGLAARCVRKGSRIYLPMPFFWVGGFAGGLISALNAGATLLTEAIPEPTQTLQFLTREKVTLFRGWPDQAAQLASHPDFANTNLSGLTPGSLSAVLPPTLRAEAGKRANLFGMTETFGPFCGYPLDQDLPSGKSGSCGKPFSGIEVRIVDTDNGSVLPAVMVGSIQVGGRNILRGICGREREDIFTPDGWYDGGDLGWLDNEGYLYFSGRKDDMFKVKGVTIYPSEIATALESIPGVLRAIVTDISNKREHAIDAAKTIGAAVIAQTPTSLKFEQLLRDVGERLSAFKIPSHWIILDSPNDLPRTATGKIDQLQLRVMLQESSLKTNKDVRRS
jgi:acyl-CoA synthetase (AMP-forming)/AMP-acid ligase II